MYDWGYGAMPHMGFGFGGWILMILFWVFLVVAVVVVIKWLVASPRSHSDSSSELRRNRALEILRERYARGEIDNEEFEERRRRLDD